MDRIKTQLDGGHDYGRSEEKATQPPTMYLRQAGLTRNPTFSYLYCVRCRGQDAASKAPLERKYSRCAQAFSDKYPIDLLMTNYKDYTIKAKVIDPETIEGLLTQMNANYVGLDNQTDFYFETEKGKLKYRQGTIENLITHYERKVIAGVEKTSVYRYDKNPAIDQIEELRKEKKQIGVTKKERKIYKIDNIKIHLDKLPDGQRFIEIEAIDLTNQFTDIDLINQCLTIKSKLLIMDNDLIRTGYLTSE